MRTIEAIVDRNGRVRLLEDISLPAPCRAVVAILDDASSELECVLLSEDALAADWSRPEEDEAWRYLTERESNDG